MFIGRVCLSLMARTKSTKMRNIRRDSSFQKYRRGPRDGLIGGEKFKTFEHLENLLSQRDQKLGREGNNDYWITTQRTKNRLIKTRCMNLNALCMQERGLTKVLKSQSSLGSSIIKEERWHKIHNSKNSWIKRR
jgi:hypothetical protein